MKKIIAIVLLLALVLVGCGEGTGYGDHFDHQTPTEMAEYDKILLERADYAEYIESILNIQAYPDLLILNETGTEVLGMYIYDPETGLATGWTDLTTGEQKLYDAGQEKDLGKPDPSKMIHFQGTVKVGAVVYHDSGVVYGSELLFFLAEEEDAPLLKSYLEAYQGLELVEENPNLYKVVKDAAGVEADFAREEAAGSSYFNRNAENYISILKLNYGVTVIEG